MGVFHRFSEQVERAGVPSAVFRLGGEISGRVFGLIRSELRFLIVCCPIQTESVSERGLDGVVVERVSGVELLAMAKRASFFPVSRLNLFRERLDRRLIPYAAHVQGRLCGLFWNAPEGDREFRLGITVETTQTRCYAVDLVVDPEFRGRGVGLSLIRAAANGTAEMGKSEMVSLIQSDDRVMRHLYIDRMGARFIGSITTTTVFGLPNSRWELGYTYDAGTHLVI